MRRKDVSHALCRFQFAARVQTDRHRRSRFGIGATVSAAANGRAGNSMMLLEFFSDGLATRTCDTDLRHGLATRTCDMDLRHGLATWTCDIRPETCHC